MRAFRFTMLSGLACGVFAAAAAFGQSNTAEVEPNDTKFTAQGPIVMASGDTITGNAYSAVTNDRDTFVIETAAAALGIYRHELVISNTGTVFTPTIAMRGNTAANAVLSPYSVATDTSTLGAATTATQTPARTLIWYGFGKSERVIVSVNNSTNVAVQAESYTLTLTSTLMTGATTPAVLDAGTMPGGQLTITAVGQTTINTEMWTYDPTLSAMPGYGNDDEPSPGTSTQFKLTRDFSTPGTYYVAVCPNTSGSGLANEMMPAPDDRVNNITGPSANGTSYHPDYPNVVRCHSSADLTGANTNVSFKIIDGAGGEHLVPATRTHMHEITWAKFTITAPADSGACCNPDGSCIVSSVAGCATAGGAHNAGQTCGAVSCTQPPSGRCCKSDGSCALVSSFACADALGQWSAGTCAAACPSTLTNAAAAGGWGGSTNTNAGCVFFDLAATNAIDVTALGVSLGAPKGATQTLQVWTRPGSYIGFDNTSAGWTRLGGDLVVTSAGQVPLTYLPLPSSVHVNAGETVAFCIGSVVVSGGTNTFMRFIDTNLQNLGIPLGSSNADVALTSDRTRNMLFAGTASTPRGFAGRIYYSTTTAPAQENCCRGTTCSLVATGSCTGTVAGSNSTVVPVCTGNTNAGCCFGDYDHNGTKDITDIFTFLNAWFSASTYADITSNGANTPDITDIFTFLNAWFGTCN